MLDAFPNFFLVHAALGAAYEQKRMYPEAIAEFEREMTLAPGDPDASATRRFGSGKQEHGMFSLQAERLIKVCGVSRNSSNATR